MALIIRLLWLLSKQSDCNYLFHNDVKIKTLCLDGNLKKNRIETKTEFDRNYDAYLQMKTILSKKSFIVILIFIEH